MIKMNLWSELFLSLYRTYIRGQNVYMDPVTKKELEDKRLRQLEHQVHHCCSSFVRHILKVSLWFNRIGNNPQFKFLIEKEFLSISDQWVCKIEYKIQSLCLYQMKI